MGKVNVKMVPLPGPLLTQIFPPWASTNMRVMYSPRPNPSVPVGHASLGLVNELKGFLDRLVGFARVAHPLENVLVLGIVEEDEVVAADRFLPGVAATTDVGRVDHHEV